MKIFAVISSQGSYEYENYFEEIEKCFTNRDDAYEYAKFLDDSREFEQKVPEEIWDEAEEAAYDLWETQLRDFCKKHNILEIGKRTEEQRVLLQQETDRLNSEIDENIYLYLEKKYPQKYSRGDIDETRNYLKNKNIEYNPTIIREIELVVSDKDL